jgi:hypothetical protein
MDKPFFIGPINPKNEPCLPIHFHPPKDKPKEIKPKIPWKPVPNKSNKCFKLDTANLRII